MNEENAGIVAEVRALRAEIAEQGRRTRRLIGALFAGSVAVAFAIRYLSLGDVIEISGFIVLACAIVVCTAISAKWLVKTINRRQIANARGRRAASAKIPSS